MQNELHIPASLLSPDGSLGQAGWARHQTLDCNLEAARFYRFRPLQFLRVKRWDYYAIFTPRRFFSATIANLGYAANIFVYTLDFGSGRLHEEGLVIPFGSGVELPRNSYEGASRFENKQVSLLFEVDSEGRDVYVSWPGFHDGRGISTQLRLYCPPDHESMNITIPIGNKRFYYNRKINCLPVEGSIQYGEDREELLPSESLGSLDWGRGVWEYASFWNWASASGFTPDGRTIGLNLGCGFGDTTAATEDCLVLDERVHKLGPVSFQYDTQDHLKPWRFEDTDGRLALDFTPFKDRTATTNHGIIQSEVHQLFGQYNGTVVTDQGEELRVNDLIGFAEEHYAKW